MLTSTRAQVGCSSNLSREVSQGCSSLPDSTGRESRKHSWGAGRALTRQQRVERPTSARPRMVQFDPASFKDPSGRVFVHDGWICRTLSADACQAFEAARRAGLITQLVDADLLVESELSPAIELGLSRDEV